MPPSPILVSRSLAVQAASDFSVLREQWKNPNDVLTVLMIIGGDVVKAALAQLASSQPRPFVPVAFSFGWIAYSFSAILSVMGSRRLAPEPDCSCTLIEVDSSYSRQVNSWVLARLVRDYEPKNIEGGGLEIAFFETVTDKSTGVPDRDWVYYLGVFIILLQLIVAAIPGVLDGNWAIMIITCGGILLAQIQGALPQMRKELWNARAIKQDKREVVCLTRGNGSSYVMVIRSDGDKVHPKLKLADLAGGREVRSESVYATFVLVVLWFVHLLTMQGVEDGHWYTLAIGAAGMLQNVIAAGARRDPSALGFHLRKYRWIHKNKVFEALKEAEEGPERGVGLVLLDTFFPGGLKPHEEQWRKDTIAKYQQEK